MQLLMSMVKRLLPVYHPLSIAVIGRSIIAMTISEDLEQAFPRPLSGAEVTTLPASLIPARAPLTGKTVSLEPQNAARHAADLYHASHDSDAGLQIWDYLAYGPWPSLEAYKATMRQQSASFDTIFYAIRSQASGNYCGQTSYLDIQPQSGVIEIGHIWFAPELQQTRGATEALYLMIKHAMDDLGYRRMQWRCNSLNQKSRSAARRLGFRFEGIFYNHMIFKGKNRDTAWYSILDDEWPEVCDIMEQWLEDINFDANGRSKTSLSELMNKRGPSTRA
jgi:RimJ/RimL family protein N-acetyltransferase